ncbi:hypothetical protein PS15m_005071 [Mucor circinelloides]
MRFNILSLGLVATVFMSASVSAIPVSDVAVDIGRSADSVGGFIDGTVGASGAISNAIGEIRNRDVSDTVDNLGNGIRATWLFPLKNRRPVQQPKVVAPGLRIPLLTHHGST